MTREQLTAAAEADEIEAALKAYSRKPFRWLVIWGNGDETLYDHEPPATPYDKEVIPLYCKPSVTNMETIAELRYEAEKYKSLYEAAIERDPWGQIRNQPRKLVDNGDLWMAEQGMKVRLEAQDPSGKWIVIFPAQLEQMIQQGAAVRATEVEYDLEATPSRPRPARIRRLVSGAKDPS
jgi:hypothetical protein